jgi:hypothetical protein
MRAPARVYLEKACETAPAALPKTAIARAPA